MKSSEAMILAVMNAILAIAWRSLKISGPSPRWSPEFLRLLHAIYKIGNFHDSAIWLQLPEFILSFLFVFPAG